LARFVMSRMPEAIEISEHDSLALHALAVLASKAPDPCTAEQIATELGLAPFGVCMIIERLRAVGLVGSSEGAPNAFFLSDAGRSATVLDVLEAVSGPMTLKTPLHERRCAPGAEGAADRLGWLLRDLSDRVSHTLAKTRVSDIAASTKGAPH
jgi:DNA-binding IscR family transcriptional regulator